MTDLGPPATITYKSFQSLFRVISHIFFREIKISDGHLVPTSGPCIFIVGPHANQFVDGIVYLSKNPRPSYSLMAAVSYNKPLIGHVGKILNASKISPFAPHICLFLPLFFGSNILLKKSPCSKTSRYCKQRYWQNLLQPSQSI